MAHGCKEKDYTFIKSADEYDLIQKMHSGARPRSLSVFYITHMNCALKHIFYIVIFIFLMQNNNLFAQGSIIENDSLYATNQVDSLPKPGDSLMVLIQEIIGSSDCICPGTAYFHLVIEKDGRVSDAKLLRKTKGCWEENIRKELLSSDNWRPGIKNGKLVRTTFIFPVKVAMPLTGTGCD
jgi:hypothetical protein